MQSIFRLPWYSDPLANKVSEKAALDKMRATPVVEIPVLNKFKRKRTCSSDAVPTLQAHDSKKLRLEGTSSLVAPSAITRIPVKSGVEQTFTQAPETDSLEASSTHAAHTKPAQPSQTSLGPTSHSYTMEDSDQKSDQSMAMASTADTPMQDIQTPTAEDALGLTPLQQIIENEFNMQILMKHNELRLIEQELAKCQIALEQLRRCELRPYPGSDGPVESISTGIGPSIAPPPGFSRPSHPAPHGVIDGPYSRHYRQWLLQDPEFDAMPMYAPLHSDAYGRSTRNSGSVRHSVSKKFVFPGRPSDPLQSIPNYPAPPPKDKSAPLVLRRSTDNQLVKLICNNCNRGNFSSIQGFLNHCRIAHKVDYKSHDAAAIDCGRLLDENEVANLPPETQNTPASKPSMSRAPTATSTPMRNLVHPLNTAGGASIPLSNPKTSKAKRKPLPKLNSTSPASTATPFTPSAQVPRLSAYFAKHQVGGDLESAIVNARQKIDLGAEEDLLSPDASELDSPLEYAAGARKGAGSGRAGMTVPNATNSPPSRKGFRQPMQRPRPSPLGPPMNGLKQEHSELPESPHDPTLDLSPHTADSNPGLVSDHEDDDHGSASEEEAPQAAMRRPINVPGTCADNMEIDVVVDDDMDENGVIIRRGSMFAEDERGLRGAGSPSRKLGVGKRG
jgi:ADA HAT complex component 1